MVKLCECGCGKETNIILVNNKSEGLVKGEFRRFILGHQNKGKHASQETRKKISENHANVSGSNNPMWGKKFSKEHREKMRVSQIGKIPWNKGKKWSEEVKQKISKSEKGKIISEEIKKKIINNAKINPNFGMKGKKFSLEAIEKFRKWRKTQILPKKDTSIELKIQDFLTLLKIEFFTHKYMHIKHGYQCDILIPKQETEGVIIPQKTIIECDGDFFHMNPNKFKANDKIFKKGKTAKERWKLDNDRTKELQEKGFKIIRLWEHEIKQMELNDLRRKIDGNNY